MWASIFKDKMVLISQLILNNVNYEEEKKFKKESFNVFFFSLLRRYQEGEIKLLVKTMMMSHLSINHCTWAHQGPNQGSWGWSCPHPSIIIYTYSIHSWDTYPYLMFVVIHCNYWKKINLKGEWCVHISFSFIRHFMIQIEWIDRMHHHHRPPYPFVFQSPTTNTISNFNPVFACVQNIRPSPNWLTSHHKKIKIKNKNKNRQTPLLQFLHSDHPSHCFTVIHPTHRLPLLVYIYI